MLEASLLALVASLVSTVLDNSVILGVIIPVMASLDIFTLYTVALPSTRLSTVVFVPSSNLTASLDKLRITVLPSSVILSRAVLAFAFNVAGSICTVDKAVCSVSPVTSPVLPAAFVPVPNAACQEALFIAPSFASVTFHNWLPLIASLEFSAIVPSVTFTNFLVVVEEPIDTTLSSVAVLSLPSTTELFALVITFEPKTKVFVPTVCVLVASPMVLLLPNA